MSDFGEKVDNSRKNRILIASRSIYYRALIRSAIEKYKYDIEISTGINEDELSMKLGQDSFDLIITDFELDNIKDFSNILFLPIHQYQLKSLFSILNLYYHHTA